MSAFLSPSIHTRLALVAGAIILTACADQTPVAPGRTAARPAPVASATPAEENITLAALRRATDRYHRLDTAIADGFVFLHGCEVRAESGPVGTVYVHLNRLFDGTIDPALPDGLIYEPATNNEPPRLVAVELAVPFAQWTAAHPPTFLGATFQREDEFGVFGLHVWLWRNNPNGMFAESNPNVHCGQE